MSTLATWSMRLIFSLALIVAAVDAKSMETLQNSAEGDFVFLGSLCFPAGTDDEVHLTFTVVSPDTELLMYDDQFDSFPRINRLEGDGTTMTCAERKAAAKPLTSGRAASDGGMPLPVGSRMMTNIKITEHYGREWFFVASRCGKPVEIAEYKIESSVAVDCMTLHQSHSKGGYWAAIILFMVVDILLFVTAVIFFRAAKGTQRFNSVAGNLADGGLNASLAEGSYEAPGGRGGTGGLVQDMDEL